jgi:hypothetical protein
MYNGTSERIANDLGFAELGREPIDSERTMEGLLGAHNGPKFHIATTPKSAHYRTHARKQALLFNLDGLAAPRRCGGQSPMIVG